MFRSVPDEASTGAFNGRDFRNVGYCCDYFTGGNGKNDGDDAIDDRLMMIWIRAMKIVITVRDNVDDE